MAVLHRLLLVIIWGSMIVLSLMIYGSAVSDSRYMGAKTDTVSALMSDYMQWEALGYFIFGALAVNLLVNWVITGDYSNFAGINKKKDNKTGG